MLATNRRLRAALIFVFVLLGACSGTPEPASPSERGEPNAAAYEAGEPYPFSEPAPPEEATPIDGRYTRKVTVELAGGRPVYCQRCAPWRLDAGRAELRLEKGRLYNTFKPIVTEVNCSSETLARECKKPPGFSVSAHYRVDGDRIHLFNDPNCIGMTGTYEWRVQGSILTFRLVDDECPFVRLRAKYLTAAAWTQV